MDFLTCTSPSGEVDLSLHFEDIVLCIVPRSLFLLILASKWTFARGTPPASRATDVKSPIFLALERKVSAHFERSVRDSSS